MFSTTTRLVARSLARTAPRRAATLRLAARVVRPQAPRHRFVAPRMMVANYTQHQGHEQFADEQYQDTVAHVGGEAPAFEADAVVGTEFKKIKLTDYRGKWVVLFFYPLDFTFVCPTEIIEFSEKAKAFRNLNTEVIGASCDSKFTHLAWVNTPRSEGGLGKLDIPLVADFTKEIASNYGALFLDNGFPLRALFIIDPQGVVRHITMNAPPVGRNSDEVLRLVQAFQYTDKHGEVCPANWKPGQDTINPAKSKDYFGKVHGKAK